MILIFDRLTSVKGSCLVKSPSFDSYDCYKSRCFAGTALNIERFLVFRLGAAVLFGAGWKKKIKKSENGGHRAAMAASSVMV